MANNNSKSQWASVQKNPTLYPKALLENEGKSLNWHNYAASPRSSQTFCVSAFGSLRQVGAKDRVLGRFLSSLFPEASTKSRPRAWTITLEHEAPELMGEFGVNQPTSIDTTFSSSKEFFCLESKFVTDAKEGFGTCSQRSHGYCAGYHGPGSDKKTGSAAWCRLENWEGQRSPRLYWALSKKYFRPEIYAVQDVGDTCPFGGPNYQLMRNFLFAASHAETGGRENFGVIVISPKKFIDRLKAQANQFCDQILLPRYKDRIRSTTYENYIQTLQKVGDGDCLNLATFLENRISDQAN